MVKLLVDAVPSSAIQGFAFDPSQVWVLAWDALSLTWFVKARSAGGNEVILEQGTAGDQQAAATAAKAAFDRWRQQIDTRD